MYFGVGGGNLATTKADKSYLSAPGHTQVREFLFRGGMKNTYWSDMQTAYRQVMASVEQSDPALYAMAWQHYGAFRSYADYIQSERWRRKALEAKRRVGFRCQGCNSTADLQTHHRTYDNLGNEPPEDLTVLCRDCHEKLRKEARHA